MGTISCPKCGSSMTIRTGRFGPFYSCTNYPQCKEIRKLSKSEQDRLGPKKKTAPAIIFGDGVVPEHTPLVQQRAIIQVIATSRKHVRIEALAGCGKSSTLKMALWRYCAIHPKAKVLAATQGKRITTEFAHGAPPTVRIQTWHSFGLAQIRAFLRTESPSIRQIDVDKRKTERCMDQLGILPMNSEETLKRKLFPQEVAENALTMHFRRAITETVRLCKAFLLDGSPEDLEYLFDRFGDIDTSGGADGMCLTYVPKLLEYGIQRMYTHGHIDMADMIYLPAKIDMPIEQFDDTVVDEAQDLNCAQHHLTIKTVASGGRIIYVGDSHQSIMGFTGASSESMDDLQMAIEEMDGEVVTLPLTVSLRCTQIGGRLARLIVPEFEVLPTAKEGRIIGLVWDELIAHAKDLLTPGTMVMCRINAPLVTLAWQLVQERIPVKIQGVQFADGIRHLLLKSGATTSAELRDWIEEWGLHETERLSKRKGGGGAALEAAGDKVACILNLCAETRLVSEIEAVIREIFDDIDPESGDAREFVVLSSIHRGKGLEAKRVICIPMHGPHPLAKIAWQKEQEINLLYVQWTRFMEEMYIVADPRQPKNPWPAMLNQFITRIPLAI